MNLCPMVLCSFFSFREWRFVELSIQFRAKSSHLERHVRGCLVEAHSESKILFLFF
jgi:hypothetical protein